MELKPCGRAILGPHGHVGSYVATRAVSIERVAVRAVPHIGASVDRVDDNIVGHVNLVRLGELLRVAGRAVQFLMAARTLHTVALGQWAVAFHPVDRVVRGLEFGRARAKICANTLGLFVGRMTRCAV